MFDRFASNRRNLILLSLLCLLLPVLSLQAASHREAPAIMSSPQVDGTDFYAFRSYEPGREGFVTLIANYNPLQAPYGGPNYFPLDPDAAYDIHITNDGDAVEDLTFRILPLRVTPAVSLEIGEPGNTETVPIPLVNIGPVGPGFGTANVNERRLFRLQMLRGPADAPTETINIMNSAGGGLFGSPLDYIGDKSFPDYEGYAAAYIHDIQIPDCGAARMFLGPRKEGFAVSLGEVFDLVNLNPVGPTNGEPSDTADFNISTIALELPIDCVTSDSSAIIGGWTTASKRRFMTLGGEVSYGQPAEFSGRFVQVSRLGNPLVNEVAIGLPDKDRFNASEPKDDGQFLRYVTHPSLPELLEVLFGVTAPNQFPRQDLVQIFLTGIPGLNEDGSVGEVMRLNTAIPVTERAQQNPLGVLGGDLAGYPNGRRPGDDVVDISLRAMMGVLLPADVAPNGQLPYTDGALQTADQFTNRFPYLQTPLSGTRDD